MNVWIKNGIYATVGGLVEDNGICYSGVTELWLFEHGWELVEVPTLKPIDLDREKLHMLEIIDQYDSSIAVNEFYLNGKGMWLNKADRVGLVNAVLAAVGMGNDTVEIGLGGESYVVPCNMTLLMLYALEMYALKCYNVTLLHKNAILKMETSEEINSFDIHYGYPEKLSFTVPLNVDENVKLENVVE